MHSLAKAFILYACLHYIECLLENSTTTNIQTSDNKLVNATIVQLNGLVNETAQTNEIEVHSNRTKRQAFAGGIPGGSIPTNIGPGGFPGAFPGAGFGPRPFPIGGFGIGWNAYDYDDYYGDYNTDYQYDYYDWVCTDTVCQLCAVLTGECCDPDVDVNCFLPDSCLNNPCLGGGTCITTKTLDNRPDFICICFPGLTGKYCQLGTDYLIGADPFLPPPPAPYGGGYGGYAAPAPYGAPPAPYGGSPAPYGSGAPGLMPGQGAPGGPFPGAPGGPFPGAPAPGFPTPFVGAFDPVFNGVIDPRVRVISPAFLGRIPIVAPTLPLLPPLLPPPFVFPPQIPPPPRPPQQQQPYPQQPQQQYSAPPAKQYEQPQQQQYSAPPQPQQYEQPQQQYSAPPPPPPQQYEQPQQQYAPPPPPPSYNQQPYDGRWMGGAGGPGGPGGPRVRPLGAKRLDCPAGQVYSSERKECVEFAIKSIDESSQ